MAIYAPLSLVGRFPLLLTLYLSTWLRYWRSFCLIIKLTFHRHRVESRLERRGHLHHDAKYAGLEQEEREVSSGSLLLV